MSTTEQTSENEHSSTSWGVVAFIIVAVLAALIYLLTSSEEPKQAQTLAQNVEQELTPKAKKLTSPAAQEIAQSPEKSLETKPEQVVNTHDHVKPLSFEEMKGEPSAIIQKPSAIIQASAASTDTPVDKSDTTETVTAANQLPHLNESDGYIISSLINFIPEKALLNLVVKHDVVRKVVVFIDNFAQGLVAYQHSPLVKLSLPYQVTPILNESELTVDEGANKQEQFIPSAINSARFNRYLALFLALDSETMVAWYQGLSPLFEQAYQELGYEQQTFNDVLLISIERIIDFKMPKQSQVLVQPHVLYQYQNEMLESLPDGDKLLMRLGQENLQKLQARLAKIRELLL